MSGIKWNLKPIACEPPKFKINKFEYYTKSKGKKSILNGEMSDLK